MFKMLWLSTTSTKKFLHAKAKQACLLVKVVTAFLQAINVIGC